MRKTVATVVCILACLALAIPMIARQADPISGTWTGDWGPSANDRNAVSVDLKFDGKSALTGTVKTTGATRPDVTLQKSTFTPGTGVVHMEAEMKSPRDGSTVHFIIDGKLTTNTMSGSWNHDRSKGDFKLTKK